MLRNSKHTWENGSFTHQQPDTMPNPRYEAIRLADEHLKAAGLPTYGELIVALRDGAHAMPLTSHQRTSWIKRVSELLRRAGAV